MYHVVIDLEMNPISREYKNIRRDLTDEVIEIGAVKLNHTYEQVSEFQCGRLTPPIATKPHGG